MFKSEACLIFPYFKKGKTGVVNKSIKSHWDKSKPVIEKLGPNPVVVLMELLIS